MQQLIHNATIVNEGKSYRGSVLIKHDKIDQIFANAVPEQIIAQSQVIDAEGLILIPGAIDDQVHFRQP